MVFFSGLYPIRHRAWMHSWKKEILINNDCGMINLDLIFYSIPNNGDLHSCEWQ